MQLIHRVADKPIQFPRDRRGPQVRLIAAPHLKDSNSRPPAERLSEAKRRLVEGKEDLSSRKDHDIPDTVVATNCSALPRGLTTINYPDERAIKRDKSSTLQRHGPFPVLPPPLWRFGSEWKAGAALRDRRNPRDCIDEREVIL